MKITKIQKFKFVVVVLVIFFVLLFFRVLCIQHCHRHHHHHSSQSVSQSIQHCFSLFLFLCYQYLSLTIFVMIVFWLSFIPFSFNQSFQRIGSSHKEAILLSHQPTNQPTHTQKEYEFKWVKFTVCFCVCLNSMRASRPAIDI